MQDNQVKILITGYRGMLGSEICRQLQATNARLLKTELEDLDISQKKQVYDYCQLHRPQIVINCAAYTAVDKCESDDSHLRVNGEALDGLAKACAAIDARLVHFSTDYIFSGEFSRPIDEDQSPAPLNAYGRGKLIGETYIQNTQGLKYLIFRIQWLYGENGKNFVDTIYQLAQKNESLKIVNDQIGRPTSTEFVSRCLLTALDNRLTGVYHLGPVDYCSWYEFAKYFLRESNCQLLPIPSSEYPTPAKRPGFSVLAIDKFHKAFQQPPSFLKAGYRDLVDNYLKRC